MAGDGLGCALHNPKPLLHGREFAKRLSEGTMHALNLHRDHSEQFGAICLDTPRE
jgi:hypothetical protein